MQCIIPLLGVESTPFPSPSPPSLPSPSAQQYNPPIINTMRGASYALSDKPLAPLAPALPCLDTEYTFQNSNYIYPNDPLICKKYKSFVTMLPISGGQLSEYHNKRLSQLNRCHYAIKLKQIKPEEGEEEGEGQHRYYLYYEAVPFSLAFVKHNLPSLTPNLRIERVLKEVVADLVDFSIYFEVTVERCGFSEAGEFRVYVPPMQVLNERRLSQAERQRMVASIANVARFWQMQQIALIDPGFSTSRPSYRFNSPQVKKESSESKAHRLSEENTDIKKTIKLSKNYIREMNEKSSLEKMHELKKHKSVGMIVKEEEQKRNTQIFSKIDELNRKLSCIREALVSKKSIDHGREGEKGRERSRGRAREENYYDEEVIFEKKEREREREDHNRHREQDRQSVDTYLQQIGHEYKMPKFAPNSQLRNTTLPTELQMIKNALQGKDKEPKSSWYHESAGNVAFKKFIQNNRQLYNEIAQPHSPSLSKISAPGHSRKSKEFPKEQSQQKLKKMVSLDNFELHAQTKSINLSEFSNDLSNVKRRREKEQRNRQIKDKVQDILMKSKKAIELLKNPLPKGRK